LLALTIANQSGSRVSAVKFSSNQVSESKNVQQRLTSVFDLRGNTLSTPLSFDGGEARTLVVLVPVPITDALGAIINSGFKKQPIETLKDVATIAAQAKLDVLGYPVAISEMSGFAYFVTYPSDYKKTVINFRVQTGRDKVFDTQLTYPTAPFDMVPLRTIRGP
jgi:hypothetical protein